MRHTAICLAVALLACRDAPTVYTPQAINVGTGHQLTLSVDTGALAYLRELFDPRAKQFFEIAERDDGMVIMTPREGVSHDLRELCERVVHPDMRGTPQIRDGRCLVQLPAVASNDAVWQARGWRLLSLRVEIKPYYLVTPNDLPNDLPAELPTVGKDDQSDPTRKRDITRNSVSSGQCSVLQPEPDTPEINIDRLTLRRREGAGVGEIRVHSLPQGELWRWLMSGRVDVVPMLPGTYRHLFEGMETIKVIDLPSSGPAALAFNTEHPTWNDRDLRRKLVRALDLKAIERAACGHPDCRLLAAPAIPAPGQVPPPERDVQLPRTLRILVMVDDWNSVRAAELISYQLRRRHDVHVSIDRCPISAVQQALKHGNHEMIIAPLYTWRSDDRVSYRVWLQMMTRYTSQAIEQAVKDDESDAVAAIMRDEVYALPLFRYTFFAAIDKRFCHPQPKSPVSWDWLADLRLCAEGGVQ